MDSIFNPDSVAVKSTALSNLSGITHVEVKVKVATLFLAEKLRRYLESQPDIGDVGGGYLPSEQTAVFRCFVWKGVFPFDAENYVRGILGPQALKFAFQ